MPDELAGAPTKDLQAAFILRIGPNANLGNVAPGEVIGVETLRLGLRSDTLTAAMPAVPPQEPVAGRSVVHVVR